MPLAEQVDELRGEYRELDKRAEAFLELHTTAVAAARASASTVQRLDGSRA
jgi:hypothetical protein